MNPYVNKIIELYTKHDLPARMRDDFHKWLIRKEHKAEKENALFQLWNKTKGGNAKKINLTLAVWKYAAAIVLMLSVTTAYLFTGGNPQDLSFTEQFVGAGQTDTLRLPDGSAVIANSGTIILYPDNFGRKMRTLYLSGEANFKVAKNPEAPFIVKSKHAAVMALGTEFNVSTYADDHKLKVTLISGVVKVEPNDNQTDFILDTAGEQFVYHTALKRYTINQVDLLDETAWQRGELAFRGATLREILTVLERKYDVSFQCKLPLNEDKYNFHFKRKTPLPEILKIMETVAGNFDYSVTYNNKPIIKNP
jgi:ferric-dicitrate binding protein FerR (iron transport regulator)